MLSAAVDPRALLLAAGLLSRAGALPPLPPRADQFSFPACVDVCVVSAGGCRLDDAGCMCCGAAATGFLDSVVRCMPRSCTSRTLSADDSFVGIVIDGCRARGTPVPPDAAAAARNVAAGLGLLRGPPPSTTTINPQRPPRPPPTATGDDGQTTTAPTSPTTQTPRETESGTVSSSSSSSTGDSRSRDQGTPTPQPDSPRPTPSDSGPAPPPPTEPTDSSPFATPIGLASRAGPVSTYWVLISVVAGMTALHR